MKEIYGRYDMKGGIMSEGNRLYISLYKYTSKIQAKEK